MAGITNKDLMNAIGSSTTDIKKDVGELDCKVGNLEKRQDNMDVTLERLTDIVEIHEQRSTTLESQVMPLFEEHTKKRHVEEYLEGYKIKKKEKRQELMSKMKWPGIIFSTLTAAAGFISYFMGWLDK